MNQIPKRVFFSTLLAAIMTLSVLGIGAAHATDSHTDSEQNYSLSFDGERSLIARLSLREDFAKTLTQKVQVKIDEEEYRKELRKHKNSGMTIMAYNMCAEFCPQLEKWSTRSQKVIDTMMTESPDIMLLQEVGTRNYHLIQLDTKMPENYEQAIFYRSKAIYYNSDKFSNVDVKGAPLPTYHHHAGHGRYIVYAALRNKASNETFTFISVHLSSSREKWKKREKEIGVILNTLKRLDNFPETVVIGGDFNSFGPIRSPKQRSGVHRILSSAGYTHMIALADERENTNLSSLQRTKSSRPGMIGTHLDGIYMSTEPSEVKRYALSGKNRVSDHAFVVAEVFTHPKPIKKKLETKTLD